MSRVVNAAGVKLIKDSESFSATRYKCPAGKDTIGYGHTLRPGEKFSEPITQAQGLSLLAKDLDKFASAVEPLVKVPISDNQFAAIVSLAFNIGVGNLSGSTLIQRLNAGDFLGASDQFHRWIYATVGGRKVVLPGLVARRVRERDLFITEDKK